MRTFWLVSGCVLGLLAYEGPAAAQTVVEYGAAAGASATAASASKGVGTSIGGLFDGLGKALNQAQDQAPKAEPATKTRAATTVPAKPKGEAIKEAAVLPPSYEDAMGIEKGMSCEDVVHRFGPPAMAFATEDDGRTMSYANKAGGVQVECHGGKVASVDKPRLESAK
jgi:hypothetical protein